MSKSGSGKSVETKKATPTSSAEKKKEEEKKTTKERSKDKDKAASKKDSDADRGRDENDDSKRARRKKRAETYSTYVYKVLKQVHPDTSISKGAMAILNSLIQDIFERVGSEGRQLVKYNRRHTMGTREVQTAVRLILPGELAKHAVSEGTKAVAKYVQWNIVNGPKQASSKSSSSSSSTSTRTTRT